MVPSFSGLVAALDEHDTKRLWRCAGQGAERVRELVVGHVDPATLARTGVLRSQTLEKHGQGDLGLAVGVARRTRSSRASIGPVYRLSGVVEEQGMYRRAADRRGGPTVAERNVARRRSGGRREPTWRTACSRYDSGLMTSPSLGGTAQRTAVSCWPAPASSGASRPMYYGERLGQLARRRAARVTLSSHSQRR